MKIKTKTKNAWINKRLSPKELEIIKNSKEIFTIDKACSYLSVNRATLYRWTKKGLINQYSLGGRKYYLRQDILHSLKRHSSKPAKRQLTNIQLP
ncbi:helix-turn-helix domain-containing protein [Psychroflexus montanilacus]|uniref:helix-turn-helix domain-containing protein n=1 Tax=Psychroflexus montanilacus TaxID=2873598 RepID=UPI001CC9DCFF|nr:helix-turn-helix domain-containing protein [Psychroflexus montanilacus]